jgi:hypothetical protein
MEIKELTHWSPAILLVPEILGADYASGTANTQVPYLIVFGTSPILEMV